LGRTKNGSEMENGKCKMENGKSKSEERSDKAVKQ